MTTPRLLVVEDDTVIGRSLQQAFEGQGYAADWVTRGGAALQSVAGVPVDLVLLDLGLPDGSGLEVCRRLRAMKAELAIVILTASSEEVEVVIGLDAGADDYVTKPFRLAELLARVRAQLRRFQTAQQENLLVVGKLKLDRASRRVWLSDIGVELRPREFDLLALLMSAAGRVLRRERLIGELWDRSWLGSTKTLDMHVSALRRKLGDPARWGGITTLRGIGYRLEAPDP